jgi:stearoyl-CoA desaturase (Delta-9 desaturase)
MSTNATAADGVPMRRPTVSSPYIHRKQLEHFLLLDVVPHAFALAALVWLFFRPVGWPELSALVIMWVVTGLGISAGYHRLFTHTAYRATPRAETGLAIAGSMAGQGAVVSWVAIHRRHHQCSDEAGDPHSPNLHGRRPLDVVRGLAHSHFLWMRRHEYPNPIHYAKDVLRNPRIIRVDKHYYAWVGLGVVLPALYVGAIEHSYLGLISGALWGGAVRLVVVGNIIWAINSFLHTVGERAYQTSDDSRNAALLGLLSFGEAFHNNHHAFPRSASFGLRRAHLDPGYWLIAGLARMGAAENVWVPSPKQIDERDARLER